MPSATIQIVAASATGAVVAVAVGELLRRWLSQPSSQVDSVDELRAHMKQLTEVVMHLARPGLDDDSQRSPSGRGIERRISNDPGLPPSLLQLPTIDPVRQQTEPVRSHTEDATLRQPNPYLMNRGHAVHPRDATAMSKAYPAKTKVVRIALTGGPCAGKSSALEHLIESATEEGFDILAAPEVATLYFNSSYQLPSALSADFGEQLYMFQRNVLKLQLQMERCFSDLGGSTGRPTIVVFDRGLLDCRAFLTEENWERGVRELNKELTNGRPEGSITDGYMNQRYDGVIHLVTAADGAEAHYKHGVVTDDSGRSVFRRETPAEAVDQDRKLEQAWASHPKQVVVRNGREGFDAKIKQATEAVLEIARAAHPKTCEEARSIKAKRMASKKNLLQTPPQVVAGVASSPL